MVCACVSQSTISNTIISILGLEHQNINGTCSFVNPIFPSSCGRAVSFNPTFNQHISQVELGLTYKFRPGFLFW